MKRILCLLIALCIPVILLSGCNKPSEYTLTLPSKQYLAGDEKLADHFGMTRTEFDQYIKDNHLLLLAVSTDDFVQIKLSGEETEFSKKINSFNDLNDENRATIAEYFGKNFITKSFVKGNHGSNTTYLKLSGVTQDKTGTVTYNTTEYITVCSGKLYTLSVSANATVDDPADEIFSKLSINGPIDKASSDTSKASAFIIAGITLLAAVVLVLLFTVLRDVLKKKTVPDEN